MIRLAVALILCGGCAERNVPEDLSRAAPARPAAQPPVDLAFSTALPPRAEVEMSGRVIRPKNATGDAWVFITDGECWKPGSHAYLRTVASAEPWGGEVFVA